jgi:uncharacterized protein
MFHLLCRLIKELINYPKQIAIGSLLFTIALVPQVLKLEYHFNLLDVFPPNIPAIEQANVVQEKFGGFGKLTVIIQSADTTQNIQFISDLSNAVNQLPLVHYSEFKTEADFFKKHKLLYIQLKDLEAIQQRISHQILQERRKRNPLLVPLIPYSQQYNPNEKDPLILEDLEKKYAKNLQNYLGTPDNTTLMLNIFPNYDIADITLNKSLFENVQAIIHSLPNPSSATILYAGDVYESTTSEGSLVKEIKKSVWISILFIVICLAVFFIRQPQIPILALVPLAMGTVWTMAFASFLFGHLNIYSFALGLILIGLGADSGIHLLSRYGEERRKKVGPRLAMEYAILSTGPAITASALTSSASFFALAFMPLQGIQQFGIIAGSGLLFLWFNQIIIFPAVFLLLQRQQRWRVYGKRAYHFHEFKKQTFPAWKKLALISVILTVILTAKGITPVIEYDFENMGFIKNNPEAVSINRMLKNSYEGLSVVVTPTLQEARALKDHLENYNSLDSTPTIDRVFNIYSLLPQYQDEKLEILEEIQEMLSPEIIANLDGTNKKNVEKIMSAWDVEKLDITDLPQSLLRKFQGKDGSLGQFTFIFPSINPLNGEECRAFARDVRSISVNGATYYATGKPIITAELLNLTLSFMENVFYYAIAIIFLILLLHQNQLARAVFILFPTLLACVWFVGLTNWLKLYINPYNILLIPILLGVSIDGTLHLYQRFREESTGSLHFVLKRTGLSVFIATLTTMMGFSGLVFSSHAGLRSTSILALIGLSCILASHLIVFPAIMGFIEERRMNRHKNIVI